MLRFEYTLNQKGRREYRKGCKEGKGRKEKSMNAENLCFLLIPFAFFPPLLSKRYSFSLAICSGNLSSYSFTFFSCWIAQFRGSSQPHLPVGHFHRP
jgi:hypothetical protein